MISKYNKFKEDLLLEGLINESFLYFSPPLRNVISKVGGEISKELIDIEGKDIKPDITFVDIDKEGYLSFTTMRNAAKTLTKAYPHTGEEEWGNGIDKVDRNAIWMRHQNGNEDDVYNKSRNSVKIGKFINKLLTGKFKDKDVEEFVNKFKAAIENSGEKFEMVEGNDIAFWYKEENYAEHRGTLGSSCMKNMSDRTFDIYNKNPEVCKMLILKEDNKILGRALIWKLDTIKVGGTEVNGIEYFMDRQYTTKDSDVEKFRNYAKEQKGWVSKANNNHHSFEPIILHHQDDSERNAIMTVKLKKVEGGNEEYDYGRYPYVDTFRRYDPKTGILINDEEQGSDEEGCYILESTSGYYTEVEGGYWSEWHDRMIPEDEAIRSDIYNDWLYRDQAITVERGSRTGVYHQDDDYLTYDEKLEEYIHQDDAVYSEAYGHYLFDDTAVRVIIEIPEDGEIDGDGDYYHEEDDDLVEIDKDSTWYKGVNKLSRDWDSFNYVVSKSTRYQSGTGWVDDPIMSKNYLDEWIPTIFATDLYKVIPTSESISVGVEYLNEIDASVLKYKLNKEDIRVTDQFQYHEDLKEHLPMLYRRLSAELDDTFNKIKNKGQLRLKFDEEDDSKYQKELREKRKILIERIDQIEDGQFVEGVEIPDLDS